ncbi:MAG: hypothetical protein WCC05_13095 [Candidatus Sulfotelmatobacter sp.]
MAAGTSRFAEEKYLPAPRIAGQFDGLLCPLKSAQVSHDRFHVGRLKGVEGGHSGAGDAILDDVRDLRIGKALDFWVLGDVGSAFTASAVEAVAIGAGRGKSLLAASGDWLDGFRLGVLPGLRLGGEAVGDNGGHHKRQYKK